MPYAFTSRMTSSSIGTPKGRLATPITNRADISVYTENGFEQLGSTISHLRLIDIIPRGCHINAEPDDTGNLVQRPQMLPSNSQSVNCRSMCCFPTGSFIQLFANAPDMLGLLIFHGQHASEKQKVARLNHFDIGAEGARRLREPNI